MKKEERKQKQDKSYVALEAAQSALDAVGTFLFLSTVYFLVKVMFFKPFYNPYELKRYTAESYGIKASSNWAEIATETESISFRKLRNQHGFDPKKDLSTISKQQHDRWPGLIQLDQS